MSNPVQIQCSGIRNVTVTNSYTPNLDKSHDLGNTSLLHYLQSSPQLAVISRSSESESQFQVLFRHPSAPLTEAMRGGYSQVKNHYLRIQIKQI
jgi:hypothetical protein